ncbi:hypothetical protein HYV85_00265 [Candidatus Woesearchaeota archaeon]|nr:hypothetical protein [Candidatus Woesearchaeota archaeon]
MLGVALVAAICSCSAIALYWVVALIEVFRMRKKASDVIGMLDYEELVDLQRDLFGGGAAIKQLVMNKIKELNESQARTCATCGGIVNLSVNHEYTLIFGPKDLKKRATFCAVDCLEYFFVQLKSLSEKRLRSSRQEESKSL